MTTTDADTIAARPLVLSRLDCGGDETRPHPVDGWYVERFWLPVIGPSGLVLARLANAQPELSATMRAVAGMLGVGARKLRDVMRVLEDRDLAQRVGHNGFAIRSHWPWISDSKAYRLPAPLPAIHAQMRGRPPVERSLAAEVRAVEEGHHALVQPEGWVKVVSDTHHGKSYRVDAWAGDDAGLIVFACRPDAGPAQYRDDHLRLVGAPGQLPCKHAGVAVRRLEREGLARRDDRGEWRSTPKAAALGHRHDFGDGDRCACGEPADPFDGLPSREAGR